MRSIVAVVIAALVLALAGCAARTDLPNVPAAAEAADASVPAQTYRPMPQGPADPVYRQPDLFTGSPDLAILTEGPFHMRLWPTRRVHYAHGEVRHMPRWLADPYDDDLSDKPGTYFWSKEDLLAFVYSPGRFLVNAVALPVTVFVHPLWAVEVTDRTPSVGAMDQTPPLPGVPE